MSITLALPRLRRELRAIAILVFPIMVAQISYTAIGFVDAVMAGRVSPQDLAAVALGNSIWIPVYLLMSGILIATTAKVARLFGAGDEAGIGPLVRQALWLGLALGLIGAALLCSAQPVLRMMKISEELIEPIMGYLYGVAAGFPAIGLYSVLRCYSDGLGRTRPSMVIGVLGLLLNIPINYIFIYGKFGIPAMGGQGCGWATAVVMNASLLAMLWWVKWAPHYRPYQVFKRFSRPQWSVIQRLLSVGIPIGIAIFAEVSIFSVIALLIGELGAAIVAGHQIALNFSSLVFMLPYSLATALTIRVGQALGRKSAEDARFSAWIGVATALSLACISSSAMLFGREWIASIYTADIEVLAVASSLLVFAAFFQFSDAIQVTAAGALRGYQDTRITMLITLFSYWGVGLPIGYILGLTDWYQPASGPSGLWQGLVVGLTCAAVLLGARLSYCSKHRIRVQNHAQQSAH